MLFSYMKIFRPAMVECIIIAFLLNGNSYAQDSKGFKLDSDEINSLTSKLSKKILLSEEQNSQVIALLKDYSKQLDAIRKTNSNAVPGGDKLQQLISSTNGKIISLLDEKQKMKYEIIEDDWWKEIKTEQND